MNKSTKKSTNSGGWIQLNRSDLDHEFFRPKGKFSHLEAWTYIKSLEEFKEEGSTLFVRGISVHVKKGQITVSQEEMARVFQWDIKTVRNYLNNLEKLKKIGQQKSRVINLITILNNEEHTEKRTTGRTTERTTERTYPNNTRTKEPIFPINNRRNEARENYKKFHAQKASDAGR